MESTTYKTMELQWAQRQQFWFLCQYFHDIYWNNNYKQNCLQNNSLENVTYTIYFPYRTWVNQTSKPSLNKQTYITQLLNSRPKHLTLRYSVFRHGCIQRHKIQGKIYPWCKAHFKQTETFLHTHFPRVTLQMLKKDLSKEKPWESYEKTPQKQPLRKITQIKKKRLMDRGYPQSLIENLISEIKFTKGSLNF